jgi:hypothetical protein
VPFSTYLPEEMGTAVLSPPGPFVAGSYAELTIVYTAGTFGIDDTGMIKISWRTTSDMAKPQFREPAGPNYTTVEASNGAKLDYWFERLNLRPWVNTLLVRVGRGFLRAGETLTARLGDRRFGSPGIRLQTNCEERFELKTYVDAFATYEFTELPTSPGFTLIPGPAARLKAILPSLALVGEPFRLALVAEDLWGNPTTFGDRPLTLAASSPIRNLQPKIRPKTGEWPLVVYGLVVEEPGDLDLRVSDETGAEIARANPLRVVQETPLRQYWGDLHGQSGETVGTNPAETYFRYARDKAFIDIVGHQGNDFQITDAFWAELNRLTAAFDRAGEFVCVPGYEWSGNTGMGGDRNVFFRREGRPIRRSSRILVDPESGGARDCYTARDLFGALDGEDAIVIAHVGGRYADIGLAHNGRVERAVEVHSTWGTFEWLLHDAFERGYRLGVVCHSDDHKGRPGATRPGASTFGAIGGLTCYLMPELSRDALFEALRRRRHYGTTGTRLFMDVRGEFPKPVAAFSDDPQLGPAPEYATRQASMGDILRPGPVPMRLVGEVIGTAPIERIDIMHGQQIAETVRPFAPRDLGRRVRVLWQGAEYRGRGRETQWQGSLRISGNRILRHATVNFLNPERILRETERGSALAWTSVTTGNLAGADLWLEEPRSGRLSVDTNIVSGELDLSLLEDAVVSWDGGGLDRRISIYRLPEAEWTRRVTIEHSVRFSGPSDLPVYLRVTQADGNQAWSSPIYLIA